MTDELVAEKYRLIRRLGAGGMGVVHEAVHVATGRRVAIKVLISDPSSEGDPASDPSRSLNLRRDERAARFEREARSAGTIDSEHVVQVLDAGTDARSGRAYMVMELLSGEDLRTLLDRVGRVAPDLALRIAAQACTGLARAHAAGIVHRDVKTANLFLAKRDTGRVVVKLLDFGIAKLRMDGFQGAHERGLTHTGSMLGSPHYMSPEQAQGLRTIDHRTDIWSLGVVLYKCLTGETPYEAESLGQLILAICSKSPIFIQDVAPWIPAPVAEIVHRALARSPDERFDSAVDMRNALERELRGGLDIDQRLLVSLSDAERGRSARRSIRAEMARHTEAPTDLTHDRLLPAQPKRRRVQRGMAVGFLIAGGLGAFVAWRAIAATSAARSGSTPAAEPVQEAAIQPSASPVASSEPVVSPPPMRSARLSIAPARAAVDIDGAPAIRVREGVVEISGALGSTHSVKLRLGKLEQSFVVAIAEEGAVPSSVTLEPQVEKRTSARVASPRPTAPRSAPSVTPTATTQPVGGTDSFE